VGFLNNLYKWATIRRLTALQAQRRCVTLVSKKNNRMDGNHQTGGDEENPFAGKRFVFFIGYGLLHHAGGFFVVLFAGGG
jgi:hypothetical protein